METEKLDTVIHGCRLVSPGRDIADGWLGIRGDRIAGLGPGRPSEVEAALEIDGAGRTLVPGFIDIHTHGARGYDFCDGRDESLREIARAKVAEGVTTFLPTTLTLPEEALRQAIVAARPYMESPDFARTPCLHIEGPFINRNCVGAQNPAHVRPPDFEELLRYHDLAPVGIVSLAIELEGAAAFVQRASELGIRTSAAHSAATHEDFLMARQHGLSHLTHFCNQMTGLHHREIGLVGSGFVDDDIGIEFIGDGIHLCRDMLRLLFRLKPTRQLMLITDSVAPSGLPDGETRLGGLKVLVKDSIARLESGALAGSTLRYCRGLKILTETTGMPLSELIRTTSLNQARSLGWPDRGELREGSLADLTLLDEDFEPVSVWVGGDEKLGRSGELR